MEEMSTSAAGDLEAHGHQPARPEDIADDDGLDILPKASSLLSSADLRPHSNRAQDLSRPEALDEAADTGAIHSDSLEQQGFYRSRSNSNDPEHKIIEETVYYFACSLEAITRPDNYSFFSDGARATMIFKWMRFHCYHPGLPKEIDRPRRDELKDHLNLPVGFGQRLGSFIINKFNTFKKWGLVFESAIDHRIRYHPITDTWLSRTWDGDIEQSRLSLSKDKEARSLCFGGTSQKRSAPSSLQERDKRQRSATVLDSNAPRSITIISENTSETGSSSLSGESSPTSITRHESEAPQNVNKIQIRERLPAECSQSGVVPARSTPFRYFIQRMSSGEVPELDNTTVKLTANPSLDSSNSIRDQKSQISQELLPISCCFHQKNSGPDSCELSARLEELAADDTANENCCGFLAHDSIIPSRFQGGLRDLKQKERIFKEQLKRSIQLLEAARTSRKRLVGEYESLKSELQACVQFLDKACRQHHAVTLPTLDGIFETNFREEVYRKWDDTWLESKRAERVELERRINAQSEVKAHTRMMVMEQKAQLKELQASIKDLQGEIANHHRLKRKIGDLSSEFTDMQHESSGTVSPAESSFSNTFSVH